MDDKMFTGVDAEETFGKDKTQDTSRYSNAWPNCDRNDFCTNRCWPETGKEYIEDIRDRAISQHTVTIYDLDQWGQNNNLTYYRQNNYQYA